MTKPKRFPKRSTVEILRDAARQRRSRYKMCECRGLNADCRKCDGKGLVLRNDRTN